MIGKIFFFGLLGIVVIVALVNWKRVTEFAAKTRQFSNEVILEMKKVSWPSREHVVNSTLLVGIFTFATMMIMWFFDTLSGEAVKQIFIG